MIQRITRRYVLISCTLDLTYLILRCRYYPLHALFVLTLFIHPVILMITSFSTINIWILLVYNFNEIRSIIRYVFISRWIFHNSLLFIDSKLLVDIRIRRVETNNTYLSGFLCLWSLPNFPNQSLLWYSRYNNESYVLISCRLHHLHLRFLTRHPLIILRSSFILSCSSSHVCIIVTLVILSIISLTLHILLSFSSTIITIW